MTGPKSARRANRAEAARVGRTSGAASRTGRLARGEPQSALPRAGRKLARRDFLVGTLATAGAVHTADSNARVAGTVSDLRVAIVGLHGKGRDHLEAFAALRGVRVVALCDVDSQVLARARDQARGLGQRVQTFEDYRDLLASRDVDAVSIVTPNHSHVLQAIWGMQAGKHVFLEKPVSHDLWEGRQLVAAEKKYGVLAEANIQSRSSPAIAEALAWVQSGAIGRVTLARGLCFKRRASIGKSNGAQPVPASVNYDLWLGPAPRAPLSRQRLHYDWHWQWATGNGDVANQGNHQMDVARRFLGDPPRLPPRVESVGGRLGYDDDGETPNTLVTVLHYAPAPLVFEVRGLPARRGVERMDDYRGLPIGNVIDCEGGYVTIPSKDYSLAVACDPKGRELRRFTGRGNHYESFVRAVRSGRPGELAAPLDGAHVTAGLSHLPNLSQRLGRDLPLGELRGKLTGSSAFGEAFSRMVAHLEYNGLPPATALRLGAPLTLDVATERFVGQHAPEANARSRRRYREPFVVPTLA